MNYCCFGKVVLRLTNVFAEKGKIVDRLNAALDCKPRPRVRLQEKVTNIVRKTMFTFIVRLMLLEKLCSNLLLD